MNDGAILVTGAAGLIGQRLLRRFEQEGRRAIGIDVALRPGQKSVVIADLSDIHRLHVVAARGKVSSVIHCGAVSGPMVMVDNPYAIVRANVTGTANILELARVRQLRRVVFSSSTSAFGPTREPDTPQGVPEDVLLRPSSVYGATKVAGEQLLAGYRRQHGLGAVAVRLSWVFGPGRTTDCVIRTMIEDAQAGRDTRLPFGRDFPRQFIHVDDAVDALVRAHDAPVCPRREVYTATGGSFLTIGQLAERVRKLVPNAHVEVAPGPDPLDDYQHHFDIAAIADDLGFRPRISLDEGIRSYADWLAAADRSETSDRSKT